MTDYDAWTRHNPIIALRPVGKNGLERDNVVIGCMGCDWVSSEQSYSSAGFGAHLEELEAPSWMVQYWATWADHVEVPWGQLDREAVARELSDYTMVMECASEVFSELAGFSKPNTRPEYVLAENERRMAESYAYAACARVHDLLVEGEWRAAQALMKLANEWLPGAWQDYVSDLRLRQQASEQASVRSAEFQQFVG